MISIRNMNSYATLTSQPLTRFIVAGVVFISLAILFLSTETLPNNARHLFKPPPSHPPPQQYGPGNAAGSGSHIGEPSSRALSEWKKPKDLKVIGLVFYGRKDFVEILDCYLKVRICRYGEIGNQADVMTSQRNLVENGGIMDEVIFAVHTDNQHDLEYLDQLVNTTHAYTKYQQEKDYEWLVGSWEKVERGNIYIKIDDDVVSQLGFFFNRNK
jgi:hypothetical protein